MRNAVAMLIELNVVVNVNLDGLEGRYFVALTRQRHQRRRIKLCEDTCTATGQLLERAFIELLQQRHNRRVDFRNARKPQMPHPRHDPALNNLYRRLDLGLVLRAVGSRWKDRCAIVPGEVEHRRIAAWLITIRIKDHRTRIVRYDELGY